MSIVCPFVLPWQERCPAPGRGRARQQYDFSRMTKVQQTGVRSAELSKCKPMTKDDYIDWIGSSEAGSHQRDSTSDSTCFVFSI